jgi:hypothetical protein
MGGIHLDTAKDAGDLDSNDYTDVRVTTVSWSLQANIVNATYQLGSFDDVTGEFTPGILPEGQFRVVDGEDQNGVPDPSITDYTDFFEETFKEGADTNAERFLEMVTNVISLRLGLPGTAVKPGKSGKKKV